MCRKITNCNGYIWKSDSDKPEIITSEMTVECNNEEIPFIIEGQLFDGKTSYSIKYVDGAYWVKEYQVDLEDYNRKYVELKEFQSHRMDGRTLLFLEYWKPLKDELCLGMEVMQPAEFVFVGFKAKEDKK